MAIISKYKLKKDVSAPIANAKRSGMTMPRLFKKNSEHLGFVHSSGADGSGVVILEDKYAVLSKDLEKIKDVSINGTPVQEAPEKAKLSVTHSELPDEFKKQLAEMKNSNAISSIVKKSRNSVTGMLVGACLGLVTGLYFKKGLFLPVVLGATLGGVVGNKVKPKDPKAPMPAEYKAEETPVEQTPPAQN